MKKLRKIIYDNLFESSEDVRKLVKEYNSSYELYHNDNGGAVIMDGDKLILKVTTHGVEL